MGAVIAPQKVVTDCGVRVSDSMSAVPRAVIVGQRLHLTARRLLRLEGLSNGSGRRLRRQVAAQKFHDVLFIGDRIIRK